jgi:hypothetical protein
MAEQENPYKDVNPYDAVQELRFMVADLNRALYGDTATGWKGLMKEIALLRQDLELVKARKPSPTKWTMGYLAFCAGGIFAVIAIINNIPGQQAYNIPTEMAVAIAIVLGAIAWYFFLSGHGWIGKN